MRDRGDVDREQFLTRVAGDFAQRVVDLDETAARSRDRHPDRCVLESDPEALACRVHVALERLDDGALRAAILAEAALERGDDSVRIGAHREVGGAGPQNRGDVSTADLVRNNDHGALTRGLDDRAQQRLGVAAPGVVLEHDDVPAPRRRSALGRLEAESIRSHHRAGQCEKVSGQRIGAGGSGRDQEHPRTLQMRPPPNWPSSPKVIPLCAPRHRCGRIAIRLPRHRSGRIAHQVACAHGQSSRPTARRSRDRRRAAS